MTEPAFVEAFEQWPEAGEFRLELVNPDGAVLFNRNGPWEVDLIHRGDNKQRLIIPVSFASKDAGDRAAAILHDAFRQVREISAEPPPDQETCEHRPVPMRFSRTRDKELICERCLKHFGDASVAK